MTRLNFSQTVHHDRLQPGGIARQVVIHDFLEAGQRRRRADRIAGMRTGHGTGRVLIHHFRPADHARQRQGTAHALAERDQIRRDAVVFEPPHGSGPPEPRLNLVEDQQGSVRPAPFGQRSCVFDRKKIRPHALVGLHDHRRDVVGIQPAFLQRRAEVVEIGIPGPVSVRKGDLYDGGILIHDPVLLPGHAAGLLRPHRTPVESPLKTHDPDLAAPALADSPGPRQLDRIFGGLRPRCQQEHLVQPFRRQSNQEFRELRPRNVREHVTVQKSVVDLVQNRLPHLRHPMARVGHQHPGTPIQPPVPVPVVDTDVLGAVPYDRRLSPHGSRLEGAQGLEHGNRIRMRQSGDDSPVFRVHAGNVPGCDIELPAHRILLKSSKKRRAAIAAHTRRRGVSHGPLPSAVIRVFCKCAERPLPVPRQSGKDR